MSDQKPEERIFSPYGPTPPGVKYTPPEKTRPSFGYKVPENVRIYSDDEVKAGLPEKSGYRILEPAYGLGLMRQFNYPNQSYFTEDPKRLAKYYNFLQAVPAGWEPPTWMKPEMIYNAYKYMEGTQGADWTKWEAKDPLDPTSIYLASLGDVPNDFRLPSELDMNRQVLDNIFVGGENITKTLNEDEVNTLTGIVNRMVTNEDGSLLLPADITEQESALLTSYLNPNQEVIQTSPFMDSLNYQNLESWQKLALMFFSPQPMENRPEITRFIPSVIQGLQASVGASVAASLLTGLVTTAAGTLIGGTAGTAVLPGAGTGAGAIAGAIAGLTVFGLSTYQSYTGKEVPVINNVLRALDFPAEATERIVGIMMQASPDDEKEVLSNLWDAFESGQFAYEASGVGTHVLNFMSTSAQFLENAINDAGGNVELSSGMTADVSAAEVWQLEQAIVEPVLMQNGVIGGAALDKIRAELIAGEDIDLVYAKYVSEFGYGGTIGDFLMQSILDPLQFAPFTLDVAGEIVARRTGNQVLANTFKMARGNIVIDALPMGIQQLASKITGKKGSVGPFQALDMYRNYIQTGQIPYNLLPTRDSTPVFVYEANPDAFTGAYDFYVDSVRKHTAVDSQGNPSGIYDVEGIHQEFSSYIKDQLKSLDIDTSDYDVWDFTDQVADEVINEIEHQALQNGDVTPEAQAKIASDYIDTRFANQVVSEVYTPDLSPFDKWLGGITEDGKRLKAFEVVDLPEGSSKAKRYWTYLTNLKKESKAAGLMDNLYTNMGLLLEIRGDSPEGMIRFMNQVAGISPVEVGQIGESLINSPEVGSLQTVLRAYMETGTPEEMLAVLQSNFRKGGPRSKLLAWAEAAGKKPGELLKLIDTDPKAAMKLIVDGATAKGDTASKNVLEFMSAIKPEDLQGQLAPFLGDSPAPWDTGDFKERLMSDLGDFAEKFMIERYNIKPESWVYRLSSAMKTWQSLMVLGFNPLNMAYNYVNNLVTRASEGVFGFMKRSNIDRIHERFGAVPSRFEVGNSMSGVNTVGQKGFMAFSAAMKKKDIISAFHAAGSKANKLALFSKWSARIEQMESAQASTIAMMQAWDSEWKRDIGFKKMRQDLEGAVNDPGIVYSNIESAMNWDEVKSSLFKEGGTTRGINGLIDVAIQRIDPNNPDIIKDMLVKTGIQADLQEQFKNVKTPHDIERIFDQVVSRLREYVDRMSYEDYVARADDVKNRASSDGEGLVAIIPMWGEIWDEFTQRLLNDTVLNEKTAALANSVRDKGDIALSRKLWLERKSESARDHKQTQSYMLQTAKGILDTVGVDNPASHPLLLSMKSWMDNFGKFFVEKELILDKFFKATDNNDLMPEVRSKLWQETQESITNLYNQYTKTERGDIKTMGDAIAEIYTSQTNRPASDVGKLFDNILSIRDETTNAISEFRTQIKDADLNPNQRQQAFTDFNKNVLIGLINKRRDATVEGFAELVRSPDPISADRASVPYAGEAEAVNAAPQPEETAQTKKPVDPQKAKEAAEEIQTRAESDLEINKAYADKILNRDMFSEKLRKSFSLTNEQTTAVMALVDAHAKRWADNNNADANTWYNKRVADVIKSDVVPDLNKILFEDGALPDKYRGMVNFLDDGRAVITAFKSADISTAVHELAHIFRRDLSKGELNTVSKWMGFENSGELLDLQQKYFSKKISKADAERYMAAEDKFAYGFENYMAQGLAGEIATPAMQKVYNKFSQWFKDVYKSVEVAGLDVEISPEIQRVYNNLLMDEKLVDGRQARVDLLQRSPKGDTVIAKGTDSDTAYEFVYRLVELNNLVASHDMSFRINPDFPQELQARDRTRKGLQDQVYTIAGTLDPFQLIDISGVIEHGAPIVGSDMVVESGNGRTIALRYALQNSPEKFKAYVDYLSGKLDDLGFNPNALDGMENPVLVRERISDVDRQAFASDSNPERGATKSVIERAAEDINLISDETFSNLSIGDTMDIDDVITSPNNLKIIQQGFLNKLGKEAANALFDAKGNLSKQGLERVRNALMMKVFDTEGGIRLVTLFGESIDPLVRNIQRAIENSLAEMVVVESLVKSNRRSASMKIAEDISSVVNAYMSVRESGMSFEDFRNAVSIFDDLKGDKYAEIGLYDLDTPENIQNVRKDLLQFFGENTRKIKPQTELIKRYTEAVLKQPELDQGELFAGAKMDKYQTISNILQNLVDEGISNPFFTYRSDSNQMPPSLFQAAAVGNAQMGGVEMPMYEGRITGEAAMTTLEPLLSEIRQQALDDMQNMRTFKYGDLDAETQVAFNEWLGTVENDMAGTKLSAMRYGEIVRDRALLNYSKRYGIDSVIETVFPYQFWFTRTMGEWSKRAINNPALISLYARYRKEQERMEQVGIPSRLKGKLRVPAPWLPDWMGDSVYYDPMGQLFPFSQFSQPLEMMARSAGSVNQRAQQIVREWGRGGRLTEEQAETIVADKSGDIWDKAFTAAQQELSSDELDPMNITSMIMTPAMWWTIPYHIAKGTPEKISTLPGTRLGQGMRAIGGDGVIGMIGNILATPEEVIRKKFNLNTFGEWGDYYIDRQLSNMATEGTWTTKEIQMAMMQRSGDIFAEAQRRASLEMSLALPGSETAIAIKEGRFGAIPLTLLHTLFPSKILPEGEIIQRGLKNEYYAAWDSYERGNLNAVNDFFTKHPEYQARIALFDPPEERLHNFLVDEVWEGWNKLDPLNKPLVVKQFGDLFETMFLNKETADISAIDSETLAYWAQQLGGMVPDTAETEAITDKPMYMQQGIDLYSPETIQTVEQYRAARDEMFPDYRKLQEMYYLLPESPNNQRKQFLKDNPSLKEYWDWKKAIYEVNPLLESFDESQSEIYDNEGLYTNSMWGMSEQEDVNTFVGTLENAVQMELMFSVYFGQDVSGGAKAVMIEKWKALGKPYDSFEAWMNVIMRGLSGQ